MSKRTVPDFLLEAAKTFRSRNREYGGNYQRFGHALLALFPESGIPAIKTEEQAQQLDLIIMCLGKLQRYAYCLHNGGHLDSARDLQVYAAMLEEFTNGS